MKSVLKSFALFSLSFVNASANGATDDVAKCTTLLQGPKTLVSQARQLHLTPAVSVSQCSFSLNLLIFNLNLLIFNRL